MSCYLVPGIRFNNYMFTEPVPLSGWHPPACAGIVVILARNPQWGPKPLQALYFGEPASVRVNAGQERLLVSMLPMPYSTAFQRRALCQELSASYTPASAADLARKVEVLEARQQEQSEQILSLLGYIAKFFESQPVGPKRPIGFLPDLAIESGS